MHSIVPWFVRALNTIRIVDNNDMDWIINIDIPINHGWYIIIIINKNIFRYSINI